MTSTKIQILPQNYFLVNLVITKLNLWYFGQIQFFCVANTVVFWANTVVFWVNTGVLWAKTGVFWANTVVF